jgi:hypothetical protein
MNEKDNNSWIIILMALGVGGMMLYKWLTKKEEPIVEPGTIRLVP